MLLTLAVIGGTGAEGGGLAMRWVRSGYRVLIGSRSAQKAAERCAELNLKLGEPGLISGAENADAARQADLAVLAVPYAAQKEILESIRPALAGKILINVGVCINPQMPAQMELPPGGSSSLEAQEQLGPEVRVVAAFQNVSAEYLGDPDREIDCDVLVCGDDAEAKVSAMRMVEAAGMTAYDAGGLKNSIAVEGITPILLGINKRYRARLAGIRITGVSR
ncbi:MAG: NADPH-dependent F420 reductase [Anaerolineales bacterium]|nr:NADPH-dependent F420 reductase [Anaerolineales bacterium]